MHKWHQMWQVCQWEFMHFFKLKQEIIGKLIMLAIGLGVYFWQGVVSGEEDTYHIAVSNNVQLDKLPEPYNLLKTNASLDELLAQLKDGEIDAVISQGTTIQESTEITLHTNGKLAWQRSLTQLVSEQYRQQFAADLGLDQTTMLRLQHPVTFNFEYLDAQVKTTDEQSTLTATGVLILVFIGVFMSFAQVFVSITGEKQQRVTEQLYSCMEAQTWIDGKVLGQLLHAVKAMVSTALSMLIGIALVQVIIKNNSLDFSMIDFSLLPIFTVFALLGMYMVTAFMAAIAAAIDDPNHSGKSSFMMLPLLPIILCFFFTDSPSSVILSVMSYFPLTAFAAMPMKMALIDVPWWQVFIALLSTLAGCYLMRIAAGRIFKAGMVMYGKEPSIKQMLRWAINPSQ